MIVPVGEKSRDWLTGKATGDDVISLMENTLKQSLENPPVSYAEVTENLSNEETAKFVAKAFISSTKADCALVSLGAYYDGYNNRYGVNGSLWEGDVTEMILSTICPLGWDGNIPVATMTGAQIKEIQKQGYKRYEEAPAFPYLFVTANDEEIIENQTYEVVITGYPDEGLPENKIEITDILGMDSLMEYCIKCKELNKDTVK